MPSAEDALPGRDTPDRRAGAPLRARHSARAAVPGGHRARGVRHGLLLGRRAHLLAGARRVHHGGGLRRRASRPNPTYEEVCSGRTGHNEVVLVVFRPAEIPYEEVLRLFWEGHDPTQGMRQGNDVGTQYRSGIYTYSEAQAEAARASRDAVRRAPRRRRATARSPPRSSPRGRSTTPRTTTSSTSRRTRTGTAGSAARACPARSAWPASSA